MLVFAYLQLRKKKKSDYEKAKPCSVIEFDLSKQNDSIEQTFQEEVIIYEIYFLSGKDERWMNSPEKYIYSIMMTLQCVDDRTIIVINVTPNHPDEERYGLALVKIGKKK